MANEKCVNINSEEFRDLVDQTGTNAVVLASEVSLWQDANDTDNIPVVEEINKYIDSKKVEPTVLETQLNQVGNINQELLDIATSTEDGLNTLGSVSTYVNSDGDTVITYTPKPDIKSKTKESVYTIRNKRVKTLQQHVSSIGLNPSEIIRATTRKDSKVRNTIIIATSRLPKTKEEYFEDYGEDIPRSVMAKENFTDKAQRLTGKDSYITPSQLSSKSEKTVDRKLNQKLESFLNKIGITLEQATSIVTGNKEQSAIAVADILNGTILYVEDKLKADTIPEEASHILTAIIKELDRGLYNSLAYNAKKHPEYEAVKEEYKDVYTDEDQFVFETIGKILSKLMVEGTEATDTFTKDDNTFIKIWNKVKAAIKKFFNIQDVTSDSYSRELQPFVDAAKMFDNTEDIDTFKDALNSFKKTFNGIKYYQLTEERQDAYNAALDYLTKHSSEETSSLIKTKDGYVDKETGEAIPKRVSDRLEHRKRKFKGVADPNYALHGTKLHAFAEYLGNYYLANGNLTGLTYAKVRGEVYNNIKTEQGFEEFKQSDVIFDLGPTKKAQSANFDEVKQGVVNLIDEITLNGDKIRELTGATNETKIFFELPLYDSMAGEAGTVDLAVLYPDGSIGIYDFKTMKIARTKKGRVKSKFININKEKDFGTQIDGYKDILMANLGDDTLFRETRVIPIDNQVDNKDTSKIRGIQMQGSKSVKDPNDLREWLGPITVGEEKTNFEKLDLAMAKLYATRDNLIAEIEQTRGRPESIEKQRRLTKVRQIINNVIIYPKADLIQNELSTMMVEFENKLNALSSKDDMLILDHIKEYEAYSETYLELLAAIEEKAKEAAKESKNKEAEADFTKTANRVRQYQGDIIDFINELHAKRKDIINLSSGNRDLNRTYREVNQVVGLYTNISQYDDPYHLLLSDLIYETEMTIQEDINKKEKELVDIRKNLVAFAKSTGTSLQGVYDKIFDKDNGNLKLKYSKDFYGKLKEAKLNKDIEFISKYADIKVVKLSGNKVKFEYTGPAKETYTQRRDKYEEYLKLQYPTNPNDDTESVQQANDFALQERKDAMESWEAKYNIASNPDLLYSPRNYMVRYKEDITEQYTDEWKYITSNPEVKRLYDFIVDFNKEAETLTGKEIKQNYIADIHTDMISSVGQNGVAKTFNMARYIKDALYTHGNDETMGVTDVNTGERLPQVPLLYHNSIRKGLDSKEMLQLENTLLSEGHQQGGKEYQQEFNKRIVSLERKKGIAYKDADLVRSTRLWITSVYTNHYLQEREALATAILAQAKKATNKKTAKNPRGGVLKDAFKRKPVMATGLSEFEINDLEKAINRYFYGQNKQGKDRTTKIEQTDSQGNVIRTVEYSATKAVQEAMKFLSMKSLAVDVVAGGANFAGASSNFMFLKMEGREIDKDSFKKSRTLLRKDKEKFFALSELIRPYAHDINYERANHLAKNWATKFFTMDRAFGFLKKTDEFWDRHVTGSMAYNYGIDKHGNIVRLNRQGVEGTPIIEYLKKNKEGEWFIDLDIKQRAAFRRIVQQTGTKIKGSLSEEDKSQANTSIVLAVMNQFKNWMPGLVKTRFESLKFDDTRQELEVGRFMVLGSELSKDLKQFTNILNRIIPMYTQRTKGTLKVSEKAAKIALEEYATNYPDEYKRSLEALKMRFPEMNNSQLKEKYFQEFMEMRDAKLNAFAKEIQILIAAYLLVLAFSKLDLGGDDDDSLQAFLYRNTKQILTRSYMELSFFYSPKTITDLLKSTAPLITRTLTDVNKWTVNTLDETRDVFMGENNAGDKRNVGFYSISNIPFLNQAQDLVDKYQYNRF